MLAATAAGVQSSVTMLCRAAATTQWRYAARPAPYDGRRLGLARPGAGGSVRVATGFLTRVKNSSWPDGAHRHSSRAGTVPAFVNECGAFTGTLIVSPARSTAVSPRKVACTSPSRTMNIFSKSWRCDRVPVTHQPDVGKALVGIRPRDRELARQTVNRDGPCFVGHGSRSADRTSGLRARTNACGFRPPLPAPRGQT